MDARFSNISALSEISSEAVLRLQTDGFIVMPGHVPPAKLADLADSYNQAVSAATVEDVKIGSTTTRVSDFVNRSAQFDELYIFPPILEAACCVIQQPFKLKHYAFKDTEALDARPAAPCRFRRRHTGMAYARIHLHG
jgi:hypothetical protein